MYLLDTNICIFLANRHPCHLNIVRHLDGQARSDVGISSITAAELYFGVAASARQEHNRHRLERFFAEFEILEFDHAAARTYGAVRAELKALGTPIGPIDTLIAGHARALSATLVTNNLNEFRRVAGLAVVDWTLA